MIAIVDWNGIQGSGRLTDILPIPNFDIVAGLLGWYTATTDGHSTSKLKFCLNALMDRAPDPDDRPKMLVAHTVKGKGVSFMEDDPKWHANWPDEAHMAAALEELR